MFWPFKKFMPVESKDRPGVYLERTAIIWRNPAFPDYDPGPALQRQVNSYWPTSCRWGGWPWRYCSFRAWVFHIWNEYDPWREVKEAHGCRILGWDLEFY